jgi:hypothetical protein
MRISLCLRDDDCHSSIRHFSVLEITLVAKQFPGNFVHSQTLRSRQPTI